MRIGKENGVKIAMNSMALLCGIDFSGDLRKWGPGCARSNVWEAEGELNAAGQVVLLELRRVQCLPGDGAPFGRLASHIRNSGFSAVAIDAPFSVPAEYVPDGSHEHLLRLVANFPRSHDRAPFARGAELVRALLPGTANARGMKSYRKTERFWIRRGIPVRSTLWNGPRGGAPFTVACLTLLEATALPIWPWCANRDDANRGRAILAEAFPAGQLCTWDLPFAGYGKDNPEQRETRLRIVEALKERRKLTLKQDHMDMMVASPDALDAVICIFAAKAALNCRRQWPEHHDCFKEGIIAVEQFLQ